ncbi:MAG: DUF4377 domain-containing protein [Proteobacteria bacterium]|nr:DUF4377 domain-containing protein [Pseudomonadota bacterium]
MRRLALLPALALLLGCPTGGPDPTVPEELLPLEAHSDVTDTLLQIASYQQPCTVDDGTIAICMNIRFEGDDVWTEYPGFVDGFTATWGLRTSLDVTSDGANGWTLISEVAEVSKLGQTFAIRLQDDYLVGGLRLIGGREFECTTFELCTPLDEVLAGGSRFDAWMQHPEVQGMVDPLILTALPE